MNVKVARADIPVTYGRDETEVGKITGTRTSASGETEIEMEIWDERVLGVLQVGFAQYVSLRIGPEPADEA